MQKTIYLVMPTVRAVELLQRLEGTGLLNPQGDRAHPSVEDAVTLGEHLANADGVDSFTVVSVAVPEALYCELEENGGITAAQSRSEADTPYLMLSGDACQRLNSEATFANAGDHAVDVAAFASPTPAGWVHTS